MTDEDPYDFDHRPYSPMPDSSPVQEANDVWVSEEEQEDDEGEPEEKR